MLLVLKIALLGSLLLAMVSGLLSDYRQLRQRAAHSGWQALAFTAVGIGFPMFAFAVNHQQWMLLSLAFMGYLLLQEGWQFANSAQGKLFLRRVAGGRAVAALPAVPTQHPAAPAPDADAPTLGSPTRDVAHQLYVLGLTLGLLLGVVYYFWVPEAACIVCVRQIGQ